jgi:RNA polymerase sigma-70 factor (ECF subfamily)
MDESELIVRAREGDSEAFNELVKRYQDMLYSVAYRILGDEPNAADATQEAFFAAYRAIRGFRGGSFRAWLMRIVTNTCYDCLRRAKRHPTALFDSGEEEADWDECLADPGELPEAWAERQDLSWQIQRALAALPPRQRTVVVLSDIQGLQYAEVAHILRIPLGTVRSRLSRGRRTLRGLLFSYGEPRGLGSHPAVIRGGAEG